LELKYGAGHSANPALTNKSPVALDMNLVMVECTSPRQAPCANAEAKSAMGQTSEGMSIDEAIGERSS